jgi:hypothetical protein
MRLAGRNTLRRCRVELSLSRGREAGRLPAAGEGRATERQLHRSVPSVPPVRFVPQCVISGRSYRSRQATRLCPL